MVYIDPWIKVTEPKLIEKELKREVSKVHQLYKVPLKAIATNDSTYDDFFFQFDDGTDRYAFVHLTWSIETDTDFPFTVVYENYQELYEKCVLPTHKDYIEEA